MKRIMIVLLTALLIASAASADAPSPGVFGATPSASSGINPSKASVVAVDAQISALESQAKQLEIKFTALKEQIRLAKKQAEEGQASPSEPNDLEAQAAQLEQQLMQVMRELKIAERLKRLASPIDVTLKSSSVRQAAEALSRASKLSIAVDAKVPQNIKVNAEAQSVPLGAVIEVIANAAGLVIAPTADGGLVLRLQGKLVVDDKSYVSDADSFPWSDDWGLIPQTYVMVAVGSRWLGLFPSGAGGGGVMGW